jgi:signal transduction histidine kinase
VVSSQQAEPKSRGVVETFDVHQLIDDAIKLGAADAHQQAIEVVRRFDDLPPARLDRHKVREILIILLANGRDAVGANDVGDRRIVVHARRGDGDALEIAIEDNGCGIAPHNLNRIFGLGFTTKAGGRGLGLHYSACAAREIKGNLTAHSLGPGKGASFVLTLPWGEHGVRATGDVAD